jgi:hypothetical protein
MMGPRTENVFFVEELLSSLDILGSAGKKGLLEELRTRHGVELKATTSPDLIDRIKTGIVEVFGKDAGALIINYVYMRLEVQHRIQSTD